MPKFKVTITEISKKDVIVEAEDQCEAEEIVNDMWHRSEVILDSDDFVEMTVEGEKIG